MFKRKYNHAEIIATYKNSDLSARAIAFALGAHPATISKILNDNLDADYLKAEHSRRWKIIKQHQLVRDGIRPDPTTVPEGHKFCPKCNEMKLLEKFGKAKDRPQNKHPFCKVCCRALDRARAKTPVGRFKVYKDNNRRRGYRFELTLEMFIDLTAKPCCYCGDAGKVGVDRLDNSRGYIEGNMVPCCTTCNGMKSNRNADEFLAQCRKIAANAAVACNGE